MQNWGIVFLSACCTSEVSGSRSAVLPEAWVAVLSSIPVLSVVTVVTLSIPFSGFCASAAGTSCLRIQWYKLFKSRRFIQPEHDIHVLHSVAASTLYNVVQRTLDQNLSVVANPVAEVTVV